MNVSVENYESLSDEIQTEKTNIFDALASIHDDLCDLARLERDLESEREKGITYVKGLAHNAPELVEHIEGHNKQLGLPTQAVFALVDGAISLIYQHNSSLMNGSVDQLPEAFGKLNRLQEFTTGQ